MKCFKCGLKASEKGGDGKDYCGYCIQFAPKN